MTLTELITVVRAFSQAHQQINSVNFGYAPDKDAKTGPVYPLLDCGIVSAGVEEGRDTVELSFFLCDQAELGNEEETLSDTLSIAKDVASYFVKTLFTEYLSAEAPVLLTPSESTNEDNVYGWTFNLKLEFAGGLGICDIPMDNITYPTQTPTEPIGQSVAWGHITGDIANQTDLVEYILSHSGSPNIGALNIGVGAIGTGILTGSDRFQYNAVSKYAIIDQILYVGKMNSTTYGIQPIGYALGLYGHNSNGYIRIDTGGDILVNTANFQIGTGTPLSVQKLNVVGTTSAVATITGLGTGNHASALYFGESSTDYGVLSKLSTGFLPPFSGTNIPGTNFLVLENNISGSVGNGPVVLRGSEIYNFAGTNSINYGTKLDRFGFRIGQISTLDTDNTVPFQVGSLKYNLDYLTDTSWIAGRVSGNIEFGANRFTGFLAPVIMVGAGATEKTVWSYVDNSVKTFTNNIERISVANGGVTITYDASEYGFQYQRTGGALWQFNIDGNNYFRLHRNGNNSNGDYYFRVESNVAKLGIGVTPDEALHVIGNIKASSQAGTGDRIVVSDSAGVQSATINTDIMYLDAVIHAAQIALLVNGANWTAGNYTGGTAITGTYQGQRYANATHLFEAEADDTWARSPKG